MRKQTKGTSYKSYPITIDRVIKEDIFFKIPIYQRLYVWEKEQIHALLSDILTSFRKNPGLKPKEHPIFYLGNVITYKNNGRYELIDGQQRFTTLWMLAIYLKRKLSEYALPDNNDTSEETNRSLRIQFAIRDEVNALMSWIIKRHKDSEEFENIDLNAFASDVTGQNLKGNTGTLQPLAKAFDHINAFFTNLEDHIKPDLEEFSHYIRERVELVMTEVPGSADLNKLFEVLNNRGVQLEHHQILKSKMLHLLQQGKDALYYDLRHYATLWDCCSGMNTFIENGFTYATGAKMYGLDGYNKSEGGYAKFKSSNEVMNTLANELEGRSELTGTVEYGRTIDEILRPGEELKSEENNKDNSQDKRGDRSQEIKSIINFPMLLQHTLRIYLIEHPLKEKDDIERILDKELIEIFDTYFLKPLEKLPKEEGAKRVADFIKLLWEIRFVFDRYIVKWTKKEGSDLLLLHRLQEKESNGSISFYREPRNYKPELSQLQRMLYHSQDNRTFYWLSPFLYFLHHYYEQAEKSKDLDQIYLQYLDNHLLSFDADAHSKGTNEVRPLIERTAFFMAEIKENTLTEANPYQPTSDPLKNARGVKFAHYWFYKLEYILWKGMRNTEQIVSVGDYKITAKSSVEHITPQNPRDGKPREEVANNKDVLDSFGNLALVSRSINSSFSNYTYARKKSQFLESLKISDNIPSLKLYHVYKKEDTKNWLRDDIERHEGQMIGSFKQGSYEV